MKQWQLAVAARKWEQSRSHGCSPPVGKQQSSLRGCRLCFRQLRLKFEPLCLCPKKVHEIDRSLLVRSLASNLQMVGDFNHPGKDFDTIGLVFREFQFRAE